MNGELFKTSQGDLPSNKFSEIIKAGDIVGIKVSPHADWINDTVEHTIEQTNVIEVTLLEELIRQDVMVGDAVECRYISEDTEYIFECTVDDVGIIHPQKMMLEVESIRKFSNARNSKRYTVNLCGKITYNDGDDASFATIKNISRTGVSVTCRESIGINEEVDVDIILWKQEVLSIAGRVVRMFKVDKNYKYGIIIEEMNPKSQKLLEDFLNELEEKETEIER